MYVKIDDDWQLYELLKFLIALYFSKTCFCDQYQLFNQVKLHVLEDSLIWDQIISIR